MNNTKNTMNKEDAIRYFLSKNPAVEYDKGNFDFDGSAKLWCDDPFMIRDSKVFYYFQELGNIYNVSANLNTNIESPSYEEEEEEEVHYNLN